METSHNPIPRHDAATLRRLYRRRLIIVIVSVLILASGIVGFNLVKAHFIAQVLAQNASPKQTIATATARYDDWQPQISAVGTLRAVRGVDVTTEVAGLVRSVDFHSGQDVDGGATLVRLNADSDIAQLHALEAAADLSHLRARGLVAPGRAIVPPAADDHVIELDAMRTGAIVRGLLHPFEAVHAHRIGRKVLISFAFDHIFTVSNHLAIDHRLHLLCS